MYARRKTHVTNLNYFSFKFNFSGSGTLQIRYYRISGCKVNIFFYSSFGLKFHWQYILYAKKNRKKIGFKLYRNLKLFDSSSENRPSCWTKVKRSYRLLLPCFFSFDPFLCLRYFTFQFPTVSTWFKYFITAIF